MDTVKITTLDNGLRIITDSVSSVESVALGIWAGVGTRHEDLTHNGVAHMVEHMLFKGTKTRSAAQIAQEIEDVGGSMNAYTSRDVTSYHIHLLKDDAPLALKVLGDMYTNSILPEDEIEREREVILQEIGMCNDTPDDLIFDLHFEKAYPDQAFGAPILGRAETVNAIQNVVMRDYITSQYNASQTVISAAGHVDHDLFVAQVEDVLGALPRGQVSETFSPRYEGGELREEKVLEQNHFILGFEGLGRLDEEYYAAQALSTLLGGGMSSRLFQEVREKRGLVYSVFSYHSTYQDAGHFGIYAGTGPDKVNETLPVICDEVLKISAGEVQESELARAKAQLKASLLMGRESMMNRANQQAKHILFRGHFVSPQESVARIDAIDLKAIKNVAERIFSSKPTLSALGPLENLQDFTLTTQHLAA